ncbi:MAG TPA: class I SAM-dependent methyltransferase [Polyangia bacterium]|jgi:SAM-dependent methyltransferase
MRREVLSYLACPNCASELKLTSVALEEGDGHVISGELACAAGTCRFDVTDGVPVLIRGHVDPLKTETAARFAEEWTRWTDLRDYYERQFLGWVGPTSRHDFAGKLVFEGGCGKGRHTDLVARFGAKAVVAIDLGESALIAFRNTRKLPNAHVVIGDLMHPPVRPIFDLAFSIGVLHHLPDPADAARAVASVVHDGGRIVYWVYGLENNEWITRFVDPVRKAVTSKIPYAPLRALSAIPTVALFAAIRLLYAPGLDGQGPKNLPYSSYFSSMYEFPFDELYSIVFDQLVTPVAFYLPRAEVQSWFDGAGFKDVSLRWHNQMSWTATAVVNRPARSAAMPVQSVG